METVRLSLYLLLCSVSSGQMDPGGNESIYMAALGRPFSLGMFYDSRSDTLVPGLTLWHKEKLEKNMTEIAQPNTEFEIDASESISDKFSSLGVDASLKASFLSGLVSVEGSAKYLNNNKKSSKQARLTLKYKSTTVFRALSMDQLGPGNLEYSEVIEKGLATHVVTGILYGAQAFFVFSQQFSEDENVQDIAGTLKVMIKKIPSIEIAGDGALKMNDTDRDNVQKFSCKFHGDFFLEKSPTTFEEAVKIYHTLPKLLGPNKENAVPVSVYLLPLSKLDYRASKLVRQISITLVAEAEKIIEGFTEIEMLSKDVMNSAASKKFPQIFSNIKTFLALCSTFKLELQRRLAQKLPLIRGGGEGETVLAGELRNASKSPFNQNRLKQWLEEKNDQAEVIKTIMTLVKNTDIVSSINALTNKLFNSENTLVFVFTINRNTDPFLSELQQYLQNPQSLMSDFVKPRRWYSSRGVIDSVLRNAKLFSNFAEANKDRGKKSIQFLSIGLTDENHEGSTINLYEDGIRTSENFKAPSKPKSVTVVEISHNTVSLAFRAPLEGAENVTGYRVEYSEKGQGQWNHQTQAEAGTVTVSGLKPNTEYSFRVRTLTAVGVGPEAEPKASFENKKLIKTLPCSPPEDVRAAPSIKEISVRWRRPRQVGEGVHIQGYIVQFRKTQEKIQWWKEESKSEEMVISGLQPDTSYNIRILCDCGENGTSSSSIITVATMNCSKPTEQDNGKVAFSAGLDSGFFGPFDSDTTLVFNRVFLNFGDAYNPITGVFTVPVRGIYHFDFYIHGGGSYEGRAQLEKNGDRIISTHNPKSADSGSAGNGASLLLEPADQVCLRLLSNHRIWDTSAQYSTFSGHLLFPF